MTTEPAGSLRSSFAKALPVVAALTVVACHSASDPTPLCYSPPPDGTHQSALFLVRGPAVCGTGGTSVTPLAVPEGSFVATIRFAVNRAKPNTSYFIQRAAEFGRSAATDADGICQRAEGLPPWSDPSVPAFVTFPIPWKPGPKIVLTTDAAGSGSIEFEHRAASIPRGSRFDVQMRLVDNEESPTSELRSGCMTIDVK